MSISSISDHSPFDDNSESASSVHKSKELNPSMASYLREEDDDLEVDITRYYGGRSVSWPAFNPVMENVSQNPTKAVPGSEVSAVSSSLSSFLFRRRVVVGGFILMLIAGTAIVLAGISLAQTDQTDGYSSSLKNTGTLSRGDGTPSPQAASPGVQSPTAQPRKSPSPSESTRPAQPGMDNRSFPPMTTSTPVDRNIFSPTTNPTQSIPSATGTENVMEESTSMPTTQAPTIRPSERSKQTPEPSIGSREITTKPTANPPTPTVRPSRGHTPGQNEPSAVPTFLTLPEPSSGPTRSPTANPTTRPSSTRTKMPTGDPTIEPSLRPSNTRTYKPTRGPTPKPTFRPSRQLTPIPSSPPTLTTEEENMQPSAYPDASPKKSNRVKTKEPSSAPSLVPLPEPSASPTFAPTPKPTKHPKNKKSSKSRRRR